MPVVAVLLAILVAFAWPAKEATAQTPTPPAPTPPFQVKTIGQSAGGTPLVTSNTPTGLAPATIGAVYNLRTGLVSPTSALGAGQVIAIVDAYHDPNALSDLNAFNAEYGYPALGTCSARPPFTTTTGACFYQADPEGTTPVDPDGDWTLEESLDIEWAHAEAPGATIVLVEAATSGWGDLMNAVIWANDSGATEVSMSFGGPEFSDETVYDSDFDAKSTSTGVPILYTASAGDSGAGAGAEYPAASPNVIAVGGTTLNGCSNTSCAHFSSETAWSGSGGGVSAYEKISAYQNGYGGPVYSESSGGISALTGGMRAIPDVSFEANPNTGVSVYDSTTYSDNGQSGWFTIGGTSVGAPNWAGIFAAGASNATALQSAQAIYGGGYASYLRDITSGSNGYSAGTGYDLVTGLGSPINYPPLQTLPTVTGVSPSSGSSTGGTAVTVTGTGFVAGNTTVDFGTSQATSVSVSSPQQLSATSPPDWTTSTVDVTVITPIGTSATGSSDEFAYIPLPVPAVSVAAISSTDVVVVGRSPTSALWYQQSSGGVFGGWQPVATSDVASQPVAVVAGTNLYVFFRATDNELHYFVRTGSTWGTEQNLGGVIAGNPAAALDGNGRVVVAALNSAGNVFADTLPSGGSWTGWTYLGGILSGQFSLSTLSGNVYLLGVNPAGFGWTLEWTAGSTNAWGSWTPLGGVFEAGTTLSGAAYNNMLHVLGVNNQGILFEATGSGSSWSAWTPFNGVLAATPSLAATSSGLFVFDTNPVGELWDQQNTTSWLGWNPLGGVLETAPVVAAAGANAFVFGINDAGNLWYREWNGTSFGAWTYLGGILATA